MPRLTVGRRPGRAPSPRSQPREGPQRVPNQLGRGARATFNPERGLTAGGVVRLRMMTHVDTLLKGRWSGRRRMRNTNASFAPSPTNHAPDRQVLPDIAPASPRRRPQRQTTFQMILAMISGGQICLLNLRHRGEGGSTRRTTKAGRTPGAVLTDVPTSQLKGGCTAEHDVASRDGGMRRTSVFC